MTLPLAVSPTVLTPGFYLSINLLGFTAPPGSAPLRALIMAPKSSAGTITANTQLEEHVSADDIKTLAGPGTQGHLAAVALFRAYGLADVDFIAPAASGGATASGTFTFDDTSPITSAQTVRMWIKGVLIEIAWLVGETDIQAAAKAVAAINALTNELPVSAANGGTAVVTNSAKLPGPWGNDVLIRCELAGDGAGGAVTASGTALSGGTTEPSFATALSNVAGKEYDFIIPCVSNADAQSSSATSNPGRVKTHIDTYDSGNNAKLQQAIIGATGSLSSLETGSVGRNYGPMQYPFCLNGESLGCEFAGWEGGRRLRAETDDPAVNRIGDPIDGLYGAADLVADAPTDAEVEEALGAGISIINYTAQGDMFMVRPITTYSEDALGNADRRLLDVSGVSGTYAFAKHLRTVVPQEFRGAKLSRDLEDTEEPPPPGVVQERDIKAFVVGEYRVFTGRGILRRDTLAEALEQGTLIVQVNDTDESQADMVIPVAVLKPFAKAGVYVSRVA